MGRKALLPVVLALLSWGIDARCAQDEERIENFVLLDHRGVAHELDYHADDPSTKLLVIFVHGVGCPLVRQRTKELERLAETYRARGVRFWMLNANPQDDRDDVRAELERFDAGWPVLMDDSQLVARMLDVERTAEALVLEPNPWRIVYRGAVDDALQYDTQHSAPDGSRLRRILDEKLAGEEPSLTNSRAPGCRITFLDDPTPSYEHDIAPLIARSCLPCHAPGGPAPFDFDDHASVRGWSAMMREVLMTKRMPPWFHDPDIGEFHNDPSLSPDEVRLLVAWLDAGAPKAPEEDDPLTLPPQEPGEWPFRQPDLVVDVPELKLPASGRFPYVFHNLPSPFADDVWLAGFHVKPGNLTVVHHVIVRLKNTDGSPPRWVGEYSVGGDPYLFPENTGIPLRRDDTIEVSIHYATSGRAEIDRTQLGYYLHEQTPEREFVTHPNKIQDFIIPPGAPEHVVSMTRTFERPVVLHHLYPHMHYRGKWIRYEARYPDGQRELLFSQPRFRFDWQRAYILKEPKHLPAGTQLFIEGAWDNSPQNRFNPDPAAQVLFGPQSTSEMFFGGVKFTYAQDPEEGGD